MLGNELETMDNNELKKELEETAIFMKLSPMQKSRIVTLLQEEGHTVGFMGDGINDAAALKILLHISRHSSRYCQRKC